MRSVEDWDRAIPAGINTWMNLESYPVSCLRCLPVRIVFGVDSLSAGMACDRLWRRVCVHGIASVRVEMSPWMSEELSVVTGGVPLAWLGVRSMWMELCR